MFEVGMSALVLKICSEYAKSLGLNFPPCTQQEINAICQWVDKHAVKDMTISQDGYIVTFTFKAEYDTTKEFTITIPKAVDIDELEKVLKGSDSVVVNRLADNSGLQVKLAQSVINDINNKLAKPANPTADSAVTMLADGTVGTKPLSEIGGKLYLHKLHIEGNDGEFLNEVNFSAINSYDGFITKSNILNINISDFVIVGNGNYIRDATIFYKLNSVSIDGNRLRVEYFKNSSDVLPNGQIYIDINGNDTRITDHAVTEI